MNATKNSWIFCYTKSWPLQARVPETQKSRDWCIVNGTSNFRWILDGGREELIWFFLMIFFMVTASPTLLFPTSLFPQNSYVQNKVWPSWKPESADVPPGKECGLCQKQQGCLGKRGAWRGNCKQSWAPPAQAELTTTFANHGRVTATDTFRVCSCSPYRCQTCLLQQSFEACTGNKFFIVPFFCFCTRVTFHPGSPGYQYYELQGEHCQGAAMGWRKSRNRIAS